MNIWQKLKEWKKIEFKDKLALIISVCALVGTVFTYVDTQRRTSVRYEIFENLKYDQLKLVADLKSMERKAIIANNTSLKDNNNYMTELADIEMLRTNPGYVIYLHSLHQNGAAFKLELNLHQLSNNIQSYTTNEKRKHIDNALEILALKTDVEKNYRKDLDELRKLLCYSTISKVKPIVINNKDFDTQGSYSQASFVPFLSKMNNVIVEKKPEGLNELKKDESDNKRKIEDNNNQKEQYTKIDTISEVPIEDFLNYLIFKKHIDDADLFLFYGVLENNDSLILLGFDKGGDVNMTVEEIKGKYHADYVEYCMDTTMLSTSPDHDKDIAVSENEIIHNDNSLVIIVLISRCLAVLLGIFLIVIVIKLISKNNRVNKPINSGVVDAEIENGEKDNGTNNTITVLFPGKKYGPNDKDRQYQEDLKQSYNKLLLEFTPDDSGYNAKRALTAITNSMNGIKDVKSGNEQPLNNVFKLNEDRQVK